MSEQAKKLHDNNPESYSPKKPEILMLAKQKAGVEIDAPAMKLPVTTEGRTYLDFQVPFSAFCGHEFLNCFASLYVYIEGFGDDCQDSLSRIQEDWYFIFGTLTGFNSLIINFDKSIEKSQEDEQYVDFCMKWAGYSYEKVTENLKRALQDSINHGYPVIAVLKDKSNGPVRVLIGYDGESIIAPDPQKSQNGDAGAPTYSEIDYMYVITGRGKPQYTLLDGLKNIETSLTSVLKNRIWDDMWDHFEYWHDLKEKPLEETKARFERALQMCWDFDHCHNVSEVFCHRVIPALRDSRLDDACLQIDRAYVSSHNCQWAVIALYDCRDWSKREFQCKEAGLCMYARWTIERLRQNDECVLETIRNMIDILENKQAHDDTP